MSIKQHYVIFAEADVRSVVLTLASLHALKSAPHSISVILKEHSYLRFDRESVDRQLPSDIDIQWIDNESLHQTAQSKISGAEPDDIAVIFRAGLIVRPDISEEIEGLLSGNHVAAICAAGRTRQINDLSLSELQTKNPWGLVRAFEDEPSSRILQARCLRPCALIIRVRDLRRSNFDRFTSLADWYAYRRFLRPISQNNFADQILPSMGFIGASPDRRNPDSQGIEVAKQLFRIDAGFSEFSAELKRDMSTLLRVQIGNLFHPAHASTAFRFLKGFVSQTWAEMLFKRKLHRDSIN